MAATRTTRNKLQQLRRVLYWIAQIQGVCPHCKQPLVNGKDSDVYLLTLDHLSGSYDHAKKCERLVIGTKKGGALMHRTCHKSKTMKEKRVWEHSRKNGNTQ